jgi:hypothetical protein
MNKLADVTTQAHQLIEAIRSNSSEFEPSWQYIADVLTDGEALQWLGVKDDDQLIVELAYDLVTQHIGLDCLNQTR